MLRKFLGLLFTSWFLVVSAWAKIVVFPFEDLTYDGAGVNIEVAEKVAEYLELKGFEVVYPSEVVPELAKMRVKAMGWIDRAVSRKVAEAFGASFILLGTVLEAKPKEGVLSISARIVSPGEGKVVWSGSVSFSQKDNPPLLGIGKTSFEKLVLNACKRLFGGITKELPKEEFTTPIIEITEVLLRPRSVKGGGLVECAVRIEVSGEEPEFLGIRLEDGRVIPLKKEGAFYVGWWEAPKKEGRYSIVLEAKWPKLKLSKSLFLSTYFVDDTPPKIRLSVFKAVNTSSGPAFSRYLEVRPRLEVPDRVAAWSVEITTERGIPVVKEEHPGELPKKLVWRGVDATGRKVPSGTYVVKVKAWDEAGNLAEATTKVLFVKDPPRGEVVAVKEKDGVSLSFKVERHPVPLNEWRLEIWDKEGNLIKVIEGKGFGEKKVKLKGDYDALRYSLFLRDVLGNRKVVRNGYVVPQVLRAEKKEEGEMVPKAQEWVGEF